MSEPLLKITHLSKRFDGIVALSDLSLSVNPSEVVGLIGPNGAGKTTLFNIIFGFIRPESGEILFRDRNLVGKRPSQIARLGIARTFQDVRLIHHLTVLENILLCFQDQPGERLAPLFLQHRRTRSIETANQKRAMALLADVDLIGHADELAEVLSYGQQKLLSIACCLAGHAELLLLDEPVAGVAPQMLDRILGVIRSLSLKGKTIVLIEHNMDVIIQTCHRVVFIDAGEKIADGPPDAVRNDPRVIAAYLE